MNDPGFHEPIESDANDVENQKGEEQSGKEENEQAFLDPRYVKFVELQCLSLVEPRWKLKAAQSDTIICYLTSSQKHLLTLRIS